MNSLAVDTGGFVVRNTNHLDAIVNRIVDDASHYYVLGYRPQAMPDGKFHKIAVKLRRPGLTFRARRGYVAAVVPAPAPATPVAQTPAAPTGVVVPPVAPTEPSPPLPLPSAHINGAGAVPALPAVPPSANAVRLRPDVDKHVTALGKDANADPDAGAGWDAYQRGDLDGARTRLAAAVTHPGARPWVRYALGQADYALAHVDDAIAQWEQVRKDVPAFEPVYFDLVDGYLQRTNFPKAAQVLLDAAKHWPKDPDVLNALGVVDITGGALADAINAFAAATQIAPNDAVGHFNLARALEARYLRVRSRTGHGVTQMQLINSSRDREDAIKHYRRALAIGGPYADAARTALKRLAASAPK